MSLVLGLGYTGVDGNISFSLSKKGEVLDRQTRNKIFVIPSDRLIYFTEKLEISDRKDAESYIKLRVEEKFGQVDYDFYIEDKYAYILVYRNFLKPKDFYALDGEIFSLARFYSYSFDEDGYIFDVDEEKFTFVEVSSGRLKSYRVIPVSSEEFISNLDSYLTQIPQLEEGKVALVSGKSKDVVKFYNFCKERLEKSRVVLPTFCQPSEVAAFGAALKGVLGDNTFSFRERKLSPQIQKKIINTTIFVACIYILAYVGIDFYTKELIKSIKRDQVRLFKSAFPDQPVVSPYDQTKAMVRTSPEFNLSKKLLEVELPRDAKIYKVEYVDGVLTVKGESKDPPPVAKSVKKTPLGNFEFEVEVR